MKSKFTNKGKNERLILFFNGWGMDDSIVNHIDTTGFDVIALYHYDNDFTFNTNELKAYKKIFVVAWSMGVWAAGKSLYNLNLNIEKSIAINGTLRPVNDLYGIPVSIFKGTIDNFSERNKHKFDRRMLGSKELFEKFQAIESSRTLEDQLTELELIYKLAENDNVDYTFDRAIIGTKDLIFPTSNQINFWTDKAEVKQIENAHFPFFQYESWKEILDL